MKSKKYNTIILILLIVLLLLLVLGGIIILNSNKPASTTEGAKTTYFDISTNNKNDDETDEEKLRQNIKIEYVGITKAGDFAIKVINNNIVPVCFSTVETIFKDKDNNFMEKANTDSSFFGVDAKSETIVFDNGYREDFSKYPNYEFNFEFANIYDNFVYNNFEITANNTGKQISVQVNNNNDVALSNVEVNVVYYTNGQIVGCETGYCQTTTSANGTAYINVDFPKDSNYKNVKFDNYKVYLIQASKSY